ncbi:AIF_collapsed_G0032050.mRNA.1.CDS.1 [Saccharomyces cerevisiae]|nr:AIF_collapsed_G0032050.mRNA.1.CDS.1 [Saccharomyces cerevisiae]
MLTREIIELRKSRGLDKERPWNIWRDGCENGETTQQIGLRLSRVMPESRTCTASTRVRAEHQTSWSLRTDSITLFAAIWFGLGVQKKCETIEEIQNVKIL